MRLTWRFLVDHRLSPQRVRKIPARLPVPRRPRRRTGGFVDEFDMPRLNEAEKGCAPLRGALGRPPVDDRAEDGERAAAGPLRSRTTTRWPDTTTRSCGSIGLAGSERPEELAVSRPSQSPCSCYRGDQLASLRSIRAKSLTQQLDTDATGRGHPSARARRRLRR
jgi:hypothetical protein